MAVAASTIIAEMRYELKDVDSDNYSDAELLGYVNEAVHFVINNMSPMDEELVLQSTDIGSDSDSNRLISKDRFDFEIKAGGETILVGVTLFPTSV